MRQSEKKKIELLPAAPELTEQALKYYIRNRQFLAPFEPKRPEIFYTPDFQRTLLEHEAEEFKKKTAFHFYIWLDEKIIGTIALTNIVRGPFCSAFLGAKLDLEYLNRGYMTQATEEIVKFAFERENLHRIEANVMPRNLASLRVLEKNGFINEGISHNYLRINGVWEDHIHMVKLNEEWTELSQKACGGAKVCTNVVAKMGLDKDVRVEALVKICEVLEGNIEDIIEIVQDKSAETI